MSQEGFDLRRLTIFIGSSTESLHIANAVQSNLQGLADCTVWDQGFFNLSRNFLENLINEIDQFDFAIFIASADDITQIRGSHNLTPRDNIIFEIGLSMGKLGRERTFIIKSAGSDKVHLPSDLLGMVVASYDATRSDKNWIAALAPACDEIASHVQELGIFESRPLRDRDGKQVKYAAAICYRREGDETLLRLVNSTRSRKIFPKGKIRDGESAASAAMRYAFTEGAVLGRAVDLEPRIFRYYKEEERVEHSVAAVIVESRNTVESRVEFRRPDWYAVDQCEKMLIADRDFLHVSELKAVVDWASAAISDIVRPRYQAGIVPYKGDKKKGYKVLLISSRTTKSWIFPKGNVAKGLSEVESAEKEAFEEAGVKGEANGNIIGVYKYTRFGVEYNVSMYSMNVKKDLDEWPDKSNRRRKWVELKDAMNFVEYDHVKQVLIDFERLMSRRQ